MVSWPLLGKRVRNLRRLHIHCFIVGLGQVIVCRVSDNMGEKVPIPFRETWPNKTSYFFWETPWLIILTHWDQNKIATILYAIFMFICFMKLLFFVSNVTGICSSDGPYTNESTLVQVMAWYRTSHYPNQWWLNSLSHAYMRHQATLW